MHFIGFRKTDSEAQAKKGREHPPVLPCTYSKISGPFMAGSSSGMGSRFLWKK